MQTYFANRLIARPGHLGGGEWNLTNLFPVTVLFGKNGSGKSLLLRAWRDSAVQDTHYVVPERTGTLAFEPGYIQQQITADARRNASGRNFLPEYRQHIIARIEAYLVTRGATRSGQLPGALEDLESLVSLLLPDFAMELVGANPPFKLTRSENNQQVGSIDELSSGEAQLLTLGLDILTIAATWKIQNNQNRLMLIDEPDAHIHPDLQVRFADFAVQLAKQFQLQMVIATHSTTLLAAIGQFAGDDAGVIYLDRTKTDFQAQPFTASLKEIAACLGGHVLMGPLFGVPLLLVEGDDDYRIWSQVPRHHVTSFAVIPSHGEEIKTYQKHLERVLGSLREAAYGPAGYALMDGDKGLPQADQANPQNHVKFVQLNCHESENLYLTDEVLALLETDWAGASAKIAGESANFGNKAGQLAAAAAWDRQREDIKNVIEEVASILDDKHVHWTIRVGVGVGRTKPTGQLADFLGTDVINALWQ